MFHKYKLHIPGVVIIIDLFPRRIIVTFAKYLLPRINRKIFLKGNKCQKANLKYSKVSTLPGNTQPIFSITGSPFDTLISL